MKPARLLTARTIVTVAIAIGSVGAVLAVADIGSPVRAPLVIVFLAVVPAAAAAPFFSRFEALSRVVLAGTVAVVVNFLVAEVMLAAGLWSPRASVVVVAALSAALAGAQRAAVRVPLRRVLVSARGRAGRYSPPAAGHSGPGRDGSATCPGDGTAVTEQAAGAPAANRDGPTQAAD